MNFHVAPRYTAGSPAMVSKDQVDRVAIQEVMTYKRLIENPTMIPSETERALTEGLQGIAYATEQRGRHIEVRDLITGEKFEVPSRQWTGYHWYSRTDRDGFLQHNYRHPNSLAWRMLGKLDPLTVRHTDERVSSILMHYSTRIVTIANLKQIRSCTCVDELREVLTAIGFELNNLDKPDWRALADIADFMALPEHEEIKR